ncbi:MAG: hypothetical protein JNM57_10285 [Cyclobacteriaceae bacterium]|nr:hypothetical protein [Cyclobacteriaceae bacterium]
MNRPLATILFLFLIANTPGISQSIDSLRRLILFENNESQKALLLREISYEYLNLQQLDSCLKYARLGKALAEANGDRFSEAYNFEMEGNYYYYKGFHETAMNVFTHILQLNEEIHDDELAARAYSMMGWIYMEQRRFDEAKKVFYKALPFLKKGIGADEDLALAYYGIASAYSYRHSTVRNPVQGMLYYDSALRVSPGLQARERAFALAELGAVMRENNKSYKLCLRPMLHAEKLIQHDTSQRDAYAYVLAELAYTYYLMNDAKKAKEHARQSLLLYEQVPLYAQIPSVYQLLSETFEKVGDISMAYKTEKLNRALSDSLFSNRNVLLVEQIRAQYEDERKQEEINRLSEANTVNALKASNNRNIAIAVGIGSILLFLMVAWVSVNRSRYKHCNVQYKPINCGGKNMG